MTNIGMFKDLTYKALDKQVDGTHYKGFKIEPAQFISENKLEWAEGEAIKYICRHKLKGKRKSIEKAIHCLEIILERDYDEETWTEGYKKWKKDGTL